jgi:hypothetical protein
VDLVLIIPDTVKGMGIILDLGLYFYQHVGYIFSQAWNFLSLFHATTFYFSSIDSILVLCFT